MHSETKIDSFKINELITSTHTSVKMDKWINGCTPTIILPHMLNFIFYMEALDQQKVKRSDPKLTDVVFYLLN
jgi:hypothetical protein